MALRSTLPPLIKGINGIVSRPPNKVNYSTLNEISMEIGKQSRNEIIEKRLRKKYAILYKYIENKEKNNSTTKILNRRDKKNENKMIGRR